MQTDVLTQMSMYHIFDKDGVIPIFDEEYTADDVISRLCEVESCIS